MGRIIRLSSSFVRPADATQYTAGDEISNHATAGSVVRMTFDLPGFTRGKILRAGLTITPATGNVVIVASGMSLQLFKTAEAPAAVGDNVTHPIPATTRVKSAGEFVFDDGGWVNPLGAFTAAASAWQLVPDTLRLPLATPVVVAAGGAFFDFAGNAIGTRQFTAVLQALEAWNPGNVANTIGAYLDIDAE